MNNTSLTYDAAWKAVGGLSEPSKMPCYGWSVSARRCGMGGKLVKVANSVCANCYALKGRYTFPNVQNCLERRWEALHKEGFTEAFVFLMKVLTPSYIRLYDSGDLDCIDTLKKWVDIANQTPNTKYWLPTKEYSIVSDYVKEFGAFPANLNVRLSAYMVDESGPITLAKRLGVTISEVFRGEGSCPAPKQGNKCLDCRACWNKETFAVSYHKH